MNAVLDQEAHAPQTGSLFINIGCPFQLKVGWEGHIEKENINIKLLNVTEDSRCPVGMQCKWEGQIAILLNITENGKDLGNFSLINKALNQDDSTKNFGEYSIKSEKVEPYPNSNEKTELSNYIVTLIVNKTST
jgi:hypothetical protein